MFSFDNLYSHRAKEVIVSVKIVVRHEGGGTVFFPITRFLTHLVCDGFLVKQHSHIRSYV